MAAGLDTHIQSSSGSQPPISLSLSLPTSPLAGECARMPEFPTPSDQTACSPNCMAYSGARINLQGSWLDLESDDEDNNTRRTAIMPRIRLRRKSSGSVKESLAAFSHNPLANFRELTHRGSVHIRKLTGRATH
ncbi:hypothetical protein H4R20_006777 [Coemansia guatemalensis]|uniref:Uncharacterized protein n=1 Tax=Coemansia guatemalensis TaxID=2761395 RepID=A0A9W8HU48_9FUNG|nr:hypothetical protein H4R20_006777 [Coemansia guatemalensis]